MVCLEGIDQNDGNHWNRESRGDAYNSLLLALQKFSFIVSLVITREVLAITKPLSVKLQGSYSDIARVYSNIELVKKQVKQNRAKIEDFHTLFYSKACNVARAVGVVEEMPHIASHQQHRSNSQATTTVY